MLILGIRDKYPKIYKTNQNCVFLCGPLRKSLWFSAFKGFAYYRPFYTGCVIMSGRLSAAEAMQ